MTGRVLIVEDELEIAELLAVYAERAGFAVARASSARDALVQHAHFRPDIVLLDIGLPDEDGGRVLEALRRRFDTPVIMVTALDDDATKLAMFRGGADDYVVKPFNPSEVIERIRAVLRRLENRPGRRALRIGKILMDLDARIALCLPDENGPERRIALTPTEFELLAFMARHPRRAFTRHELLDHVAPESEASDRVIDSHVSKLRAKLVASGCTDPIEQVRGIGYRLWSAY